MLKNSITSKLAFGLLLLLSGLALFVIQSTPSAQGQVALTPTPGVSDQALAQYNVLYLVPSTVDPSSLVSAARLSSWGAKIVTDWGDVTPTEQTQPLDALVLHRDMAATVDRQWLAEQHREGLVVAGLGLWMKDLAEIVSNPLVADSWPTSPWWEANSEAYVFSVSHFYVAGDAAVIARLEQSGELFSTGPLPQIQSQMVRSWGGSQDVIRDADGLRLFVFQLTKWIAEAHTLRASTR